MSDYETKLPPTWVTSSLGELVYVNPRWLNKEPTESDLVSFVPMAAVEAESGRLDATNARTWKEVSKGYTKFQEGDVLFAKITPCMENGKFALATGLLDGRAVGSTEFHVLRSICGLEPKFVLYFLFRNAVRHDARIRMKGAAGQLRVPPEFLSDLPFPLPPTSEQRRIVAEIEKQFTRLEAGVDALRRVRVSLKRYRAAVLKAAVEGRLVSTEADVAHREGRSYETASELLPRILTERRSRWEADQLRKFRASGKPPKDDKWKQKYKEPEGARRTSLPSLPDGWVYASADQCTSMITDGEHITPQRSDSGIFLLSARNVLDGRLSVREVDYVSEAVYERLIRRFAIESGDVLLSCSGSVGRSCVVPEGMKFALVRSVAVLRPLLDMGRYQSLALRSSNLQAQITEKKTQTAQSNIFQSKIKALVFPLPPFSEQQRIVAEVDRRLSVIEELETEVDSDLRRAERLRQAILKRAFEGKFAPQDPSDESAGILLERISAERETKRSARPAARRLGSGQADKVRSKSKVPLTTRS